MNPDLTWCAKALAGNFDEVGGVLIGFPTQEEILAIKDAVEDCVWRKIEANEPTIIDKDKCNEP